MTLENYIEDLRTKLSVIKEFKKMNFVQLAELVGVNHMTLGKFMSRHSIGEDSLIRIEKFILRSGKFD